MPPMLSTALIRPEIPAVGNSNNSQGKKFMKNLLRKVLSTIPVSSISFTARSAVIATTLAAAGRVFAGSSPSGGGMHKNLELTDVQAEALKSLVLEKLKSGQSSPEEFAELQAIIEKIETQKTEIEMSKIQ